jgi:ribose/xylose/arabinose/galactoside ABC-type transport system permease subunit
VKRLLASEYWVLYVGLLYFFALLACAPELGSAQNLRNIFSNMLPLLVVAVGQTVVLISGGIDLSATSTIGLCSVVGAFVMSGDSGALAGNPAATPAGIAVMILTGCLIGLLNGAAIARFRMPPFIVTLTGMMFVSGLAIRLTQSRAIYSLPASFTALGKGSTVGIPHALLVAAAVTLGAHVMLSRSLPGRWIYAVGMNATASRISGVPVGRVLTIAYVISGGCAAVASILYTARLETGSPVLGQRILLDVIGAAVIGGTSLFGGKGKVTWTMLGVWFICVIDNSLNMLGLSYFVVMMVKGGVILLAALVDAARSRLMAASGWNATSTG